MGTDAFGRRKPATTKDAAATEDKVEFCIRATLHYPNPAERRGEWSTSSCYRSRRSDRRAIRDSTFVAILEPSFCLFQGPH